MKKIFLFAASSFLMSQCISQQIKPLHQDIAGQFENYYNKGYYDSVFLMYSKEMQEALPIDKNKQFLTGLQAQAGQILKKTFIKYEYTFAVYKTSFENVVLSLYISVDNNSNIDGLFIKPFLHDSFPKMERNVTKMQLPFKGEWAVLWGGDTKELNYHVESPAQKNAFDIVITGPDGRSFSNNGMRNEDYFAFEKEILAPCDGEIVLVVDGIKDNRPGMLNPVYIPGNTVIIKTAHNEFLFLAHFRQHSILVKQGQRVKQGQALGKCGNSGNSSEPHLHFHIQNAEDMTEATGVKCHFDSINVNGNLQTDYSPVKKDRISNP